jgi:hypothetical protein
MNNSRKLISGICLTLIIFFSCEKNEEALPSQSPVVAGGTLASVRQPNGGIVSFVQLTSGDIFIHTQYAMDGDVSDEAQHAFVDKLQNMVSSGKDYAEIYTSIAGNSVNETSLKAIKNADVVYKKMKQQQIEIPSEILDEILAKKAIRENDDDLGRVQACDDLGQDNWGTQWFLDNFSMVPKPVTLPNGSIIYPPLPSNFSSLIRTNYTSSITFSEGMNGKTFFRLNVAAPDFTSGVQVRFFTIDTSGCCCGGPCGILQLREKIIVPLRTVSFFTFGTLYNNVYDVVGLTSCRRAHFARLKDL